MRLGSVRVRLTLWNVGVLAFVLVGFGATLLYTVHASLERSIDRELVNRGQRWTRMLDRPDSMIPALGRPGLTLGPMYLPRQGSFMPGAPPFPEQRDRRSDPPRPERDRGPVGRPRFLDPQGAPFFPYSDDEPWDHHTFVLSLAGQVRLSTVRVDGEPYRVYSGPLWRAGSPVGVVQAAYPLADMERLNQGLTRTLLTLIPLALAVAGLGGAFLTDRALRPVRRVTQTAAQISAADLSRRLGVDGNDEIAELSATFNGMIERLESAFEQQRRFTADASHELRTPLTTIKANTSLALAAERTPAEYREALRAADQAADTMHRIVQDLLLLARWDGGQLVLDREPVAVREILERAAGTVRDRARAPIRIEPVDPTLGTPGDSHHLIRLVVNLLENSLRHTPPDGSITLSAEAKGDRVVIAVEDTGEGIPPEHLPHVCERFYRVDEARSRRGGGPGPGTGLGLSICQSIAQAHGGSLEIESEPGLGTRVRVELPRTAAPAEAPALLAGHT